MADGKISVDVDKLYQEKASTNGKANGNGIRKYSLDELMGYDAEQTLLEKMKKRGEMSVMDIYMLNKMEREDRLQQQSPIDVEAIIEKATAPFREQLAEMKRQQEKAEQDKKFDALRARLANLTDALEHGNNHKRLKNYRQCRNGTGKH